LIASKWDFSTRRKAKPGRPPIPTEVEQLGRAIARENPGWGYDRIVGALANLGYHLSDQTIGNILKATQSGNRSRSQTKILLGLTLFGRHKEVLWATDFFTTEVWNLLGTQQCPCG